jgi:hypothetical protein
MAQRTIIIESNKRGSNLNAFNEINQPISVDTETNFNYKWNSRVDNIKIDVGDTIQVEACAINTKGATDGMIEITGEETAYSQIII